MGKYSQIVDLIEQSVPEYTSLKIVPRGTPVYSDLLMTGQMRFARRTGANFAVLNPDNQFKLKTDGQVQQSVLQVDRILPWLEQDALITFNQTEMLEVETWDESAGAVFIREPLSAPREAGTTVTLWATPLKVHFDSLQGTTQLFVRSRYQIVNGDAVTIPLTDALNSLHQINVVKASLAGQDLDPDFPFIFVLDLSEPLPISLLAEEHPKCFLRAFPSYVSNVIRIPKQRSGQIGPFLLDFVASPLDAIASYPETFSVRTLSSADQVVEGGTNWFKTVGHNYPVVQRPIWAENMIFWRMIRGHGGFTLPNRFLMVTNSQLNSGEFVARISTRMVPPLTAGVRYDFKVKANTAGTFIAIPYPYPAVTVEVPQNSDTVVTIETPKGGEPIKRLDFLFKTTRVGTEVQISDATLPNDMIVGSFQYAYVFRVLGTTNFQATSIIVKPYFLSLSDMTARYDDGKKFNSGFIFL